MAFNSGQILTARDLNSPAGKLSLSANQSIPNTTTTVVLFDTVQFDYRGTVDAANNQFVAPIDGVYMVVLTVRWANSSTGDRVSRIRINSTPEAQEVSKGVGTAQGGSTMSLAELVSLTSGDAVDGEVFQNTGGSLAVTTNFGGTSLAMHFVRN